MVLPNSLSSYYEKFLATGEVKCIDEEIPFEIPQGWEWVRLGNIATIIGGYAYKSQDFINSSNNQVLRLGNIKNDFLKHNASPVYISDDLATKTDKFRCHLDDILITMTGTRKKRDYFFSYKVEQNDLNYFINQRVGILRFYISEVSMFMIYALKAENTLQNVFQYETGTANQGNLGAENIAKVYIPLPPLSEQLRIVSKIKELMPLVEAYEQTQNELNTLNTSLNELLCKSILQEAIQGKLVLQVAEEGTAQELLERIRQEKLHLVKEGKLKKSALTDSVIYKGDDNKYYEQVGNENIDITEEIPFDLPENWTWVRFGQYVRMSIGKTPPRGETKYWANGKYPWVSISDMSDYGLVTTTKESVSEYAKSLFGEISPVGTLIMSFKLTVGRTSLLNTSAYHNEAIISIYPFVDKNYQARNFLFHILPIISNLGDTKDAIKGKTLNSKSLNNLLLPLPPLNEQGRIVAMIELLFDKLK